MIDAGTGRPVPGALVRLQGGTDRPIPAPPDASGRAGGPPTGPPTLLTNRDGRFLFRNLPPGSYNAAVSIAGYTPGMFGRLRLDGPGRPIVIGENDRVLDATIRLWKMAAITGTVTDEAGEPVIGIGVAAFRRSTVGGRRRLLSGPRTQTDDRGFFRIAGLTPGDYLVAVPMTVTSVPASTADEYMEAMRSGSTTASITMSQQRMESGAPSSMMSGLPIGDQQVAVDQMSGFTGQGTAMPLVVDGRFLTYPTAFHGGGSSPQATVITLESGDTRTDVDVRLRAMTTARVSGIITGPDGPVPSLGVRLVPAELEESALTAGLEAAVTMTDGAGRFTFPGVPAGSYVLKAYRVPQTRMAMSPMENLTVVGGVVNAPVVTPPQQQAVPTFWAQLPVAVGRDDVTDLAVSLRPGLRVSGRVEFQGTQAPPQPLPSVTVSLQPVDGRVLTQVAMPPGRTDGSGVFSTSGYPSGRYWLNVTAPLPAWTMKSIQAGGVNLLERPLDLDSADVEGITVTFTNRIAELSGTVSGGGGANDDVAVVVFPADYQAWLEGGRSPRRTITALADRKGAYQLRLPPPGDYIVAAVLNERIGEMELPQYAALARMGTRMTVGEGEKKTLSLTAREIR